MFHNSFLDLALTLHRLLKEPIKDILRQEDDFNKFFINALPPKDEALINSVIPSPKIDPTHEDTILQEDIFGTSFNDLTILDEQLDDDVDYSLNVSLPYESTLVKEDDIMIKEGDMIDNSLNNTSPSIHFNNLPPRDEASIRHDCPFPKVCHTL